MYEQLIKKLEKETSGIVFSNLKDQLIRMYGVTNRSEVLDCLMNYVFNGQIMHWRTFLLTDIIKLQSEKEYSYTPFWEKAIQEPLLSYWSIDGLLKTKGCEAYPELVKLINDSSVKLDSRAKAIKEISVHSQQLFDKNLPSDPGYWKEEDLRVNEVNEWASAGFPRGEGHKAPDRYTALDTPMTKFEKLMARLDEKLSKKRLKQNNDPANPCNYLSPARPEEMEQIEEKWLLPTIYKEFLMHYSPLSVNLKSINLYGASELIKRQAGYVYNGATQEKINDWPNDYIVIADRGADPYCLDLSLGDTSPVFFARHGEGRWKFQEDEKNFESFIRKLIK